MKVLVVDDESAVREVLSLRIANWGFEPRTSATAEEAVRVMEEWRPDVVLSDVVLPDSSGLELLERLRHHDPSVPVILITAHGTIDSAVEAMKRGARDFLTKPLDYPSLHMLLEATARELREREEVRALESRLDQNAGLGELLGESKVMREQFRLIELLAKSDTPALITGESGTGKEVVARTVHALSSRRNGPFVAVNAAAIPESLSESEIFGHDPGACTWASRSRPVCFALADCCSLFPDEIAEMPLALQPKLLRILEDGRVRRPGGTREVTVNVRVLAATNVPPAVAVREGRLREDLYYRLNVFELTLPPLRERRGDLPLLAHHFVRMFNEKHGMRVEGIRKSTLERLESHSWPGNVRELRNVIERAVIVAQTGWIEPSHLPPYLQALEPGAPATLMLPLGTTLADAERLL